MAITYGVVPVRASYLTATGTTAVFSVTAAPSAGSLLVMSGASGNLGAMTISIMDTKGNTWVVDNGPNSGGFGYGWTASTLQSVGTLTTSDTITVTFSGSISGFGVAIDVREFIGASNTVDSSNSTSNSGTTGPVNSGASSPHRDGCALVASFNYGAANTATFNATGTVGTYLDTQTTNCTVGGNSRELASAYLIGPTAGVSQQLDLTFASSSSLGGQITSYQPVITGIASAYALQTVTGTGTATLAVTNTSVGDVWVVWACPRSGTVSVSGVSGGGATGWTQVDGPWTDGLTRSESLWIGTMNSTGAQTITVTYSGSVASITCTIDAHAFTSPMGAGALWTPWAHGHQSNVSSTTISFPTLTPPAGVGALYYGHAQVSGTFSTPTPSGFVAAGDANGNPEIYGDISAPTTPTLTQTAATSQVQAAIISDSQYPKDLFMAFMP